MKILVEIDKLNNHLYKNLSIKILPKTITFIVGRSGSGKTTLLKHLRNGNSDKIGYVLQDFGLFSNMTVYDNILFAARYHNILNCEPRAIELIRRLQIETILNKYPNEISGGQKQRVAIIRQLILNNDLVLLDEPTSALDEVTIDELRKIIEEEMSNTAFVIVTHNLSFINNFKSSSTIIDLDKYIK